MKKRFLQSCALVASLAFAPVTPGFAEGLPGAYLAARQASLLGDYEAAARYFSRALVYDPTNPTLMENAVGAYIGLGQVDRALPIARATVEIGIESQLADMVVTAAFVRNSDFDAIFNGIEQGRAIGPLVDGLLQSWSFVGQGAMSDALMAFDEVIEAPGLRSFGLYHKALALGSVGDFEGADAIFGGTGSDALRRTRRGTIAHAQVLSQLERNDDAVQLIEAVFGSDLDPDLAAMRDALRAGALLDFDLVRTPQDGISEIFFSVAGALDGEMADDFTLIYARLATFLRPDHIEAILLSARLLEQLELYDLATQSYDSVPRDHPAFHAAELGRAGALRLAGRLEAAAEVLQQLSETHGNLPVVQQALGDALRRLDRHTEAGDAYSLALALHGDPEPAHWFLYYSRAITYERTDQWPLAEADFRRALELNPGQPQVLNYLGYSLVEKQIKLDEALGMIEQAVAARPEAGYIVDSLGWVLYRLGRYDEAVTHLERAAALEPVDPVVNDHLGDAFWAVGRLQEAHFQWNRALSFDPAEEDATRIRLKLELGLDEVLVLEGLEPILVANDDS